MTNLSLTRSRRPDCRQVLQWSRWQFVRSITTCVYVLHPSGDSLGSRLSDLHGIEVATRVLATLETEEVHSQTN